MIGELEKLDKKLDLDGKCICSMVRYEYVTEVEESKAAGGSPL